MEGITSVLEKYQPIPYTSIRALLRHINIFNKKNPLAKSMSSRMNVGNYPIDAAKTCCGSRAKNLGVLTC